MKITKNIRGFACLLVLALCFSASAFAQSESKADSVARVAADRGEVRWQPQVEYGRLVLTVSAPGGEVFRKEFEAGTTPSFSLTDKLGNSLPDGDYAYELRVIPNLSSEVRKALAASREKGNSDEVIRDLQNSDQLPTKTSVQSGSFRVEGGKLFVGAPEEGTEPRGGSGNEIQSKKKGGGTVTILDQVIPDDLIVQGSACVGLDCVNNENFGFDTIRMKENNTRIQFDDTSGAGFPTNNWQIRANSSAGGGASFLGFVDQGAAGNSETGTIVFSTTAGAPANSLFVSSIGRVGLRTGTPVLDLHINTSNTPAHRLEQNSSGGFTAQTWDIAGNEANFFVRDVTSGSLLPFRIRPGAPTSSLDIASSGFVGIGNQSPTAPLTFTGGATGDRIHLFPSTAGARFGMGIQSGEMQFYVPSGAQHFSFNTGGDLQTSGTNELVRINSNGNVGIGTTNPLGRIDVNGSIFQRGVQLFADYVFEPTYTLESIEDHATFMWNNKHLPAVGGRKVDENGREIVEIGARMRGMLEEIEKAHIYISTLNERISQKDDELAKLSRQNAELAERLARIEAMLSGSKSDNK